MDNLFKAAFKSQTVCGAIHFCLFLGSWPTVIILLNGFLDKDRLTFNCTPKPSDVTKQLCYDDYISTVSPVLIPLNFAYITCAAVGFLWITFIVYSIPKMQQIKKEQSSQLKKRLSRTFMWVFLFHVCCQLVVLGVMMGLFCHYQTLSLPVVYMCSQRNTTQIPVNQEKNMTCSDMHYRQKSKLNIGVITIMAISIALCAIAIIHLLLTKKEFLEQLVGDPEGDDAEVMNLEASAEGHSSASSSDKEETEDIKAEAAEVSSWRELPNASSSDCPDAEHNRNSAQLTEQDLKDVNEQQELDQYEQHDTWLELAKRSYSLFKGQVNKERTDQQLKRINLFKARFRDHLPVSYMCDGCEVKLSGRQYRCLNCFDVDFCYDCCMAGVKPKEHTENHDVIEMRCKCGVCKGFIIGTRFYCYECQDFFLCVVCQSRHPADHKVTKFPVKIKKEPFVEECQKQLQSHYNTFSKVKIVPWEQSSAVHIDEIYTQLSWVRDDRKPSGVTQEKLEDYTDIFKGNKHHPNPKRILVSGLPGIGKSTFSKKTAFDWSQQEKRVLMKFDLVLLIKLRDVCNMKDIRDVLKASKLLASDGVVSVDDVYDYIRRNQEEVLLILDGYDEYNCAGEQSPVHDIWESYLLRDCHVIMTTRRSKVDELRCPSHVQFEIEGFKSEDQVKAFARMFLKDKKTVDEFVKDLREKDLKDIAKIPLLLLMLCLLWNGKHQRGLPKSRAGIYTDFIQTLLDHLIEKDADSRQFRRVDDYKEELCELGKFAFSALLQDNLSFRVSELPDNILSTKLIEVGLFHVLNVSNLIPEKRVFFIHKSLQEFLAACYLKEVLSKEESTSCLSEIDSFEKIVKMIEVLKFVCELSAEAACPVLSHLGMVGKKEGLTEYNFTELPSAGDLSLQQQQFLTLILRNFMCCAAEKRRDLYSMLLSYVGGVLYIDPDQLHSVANEHLLKSAPAPEFIFFKHTENKHPVQKCRDLITVVEDVNAVVVTCSGEKKASDFLKKYPHCPVFSFFLKKEEKMNIFIESIYSDRGFTLRTELLKELISSLASTQKKKPVGGQSNEQDNRTALCLTDNNDSTTREPRHCLSPVSSILLLSLTIQELETLIEVLPFVASPVSITITGSVFADPQLAETLVSRINFTHRLEVLILQRINLTAKAAAIIARSLHQAPNLHYLNLSRNPLGEGVSDLTQRLSCVPHLKFLYLEDVKMTKKQVNDLTEAVRQSKIFLFESSYHDEDGNLKPEHEWPAEDYLLGQWWEEFWWSTESIDELESGSSNESEDELEPGSSNESEDELEPGTSNESESGAWDIK